VFNKTITATEISGGNVSIREEVFKPQVRKEKTFKEAISPIKRELQEGF
jgi:hypothetical protein